MDDCILHNQRCGKSRGALELVTQRRPGIRVVDYLTTPPSVDELAELCRQGGLQAKDLVRHGEARFAELGLSLDDARDDRGWLQVLHDHPVLMQRPIVRIDGRVVVARPSERVLELFS
ncbi:MAG: arsenate reductase (glutaredoxin) [Planctomycetes bacterium]|nr:arsenate reductase (glutaredoxin) [Planctomycetota bacterium]